MKMVSAGIVVLVLSLIAVSDVFAASGPPPTHAVPPSVAGQVAVTHGIRAAPGEAPKAGGRPGAVSNRQAPTPVGDKGSTSINGTGVGARRSSSVNGTGMGVQHNASINGTGMGARH